MSIRVGMSGFAYPTWIGGFYPAGTKSGDLLPYYASRFGTLEIQTRFRPPSAASVERWKSSLPPSFRLAPKATRSITLPAHMPAALEGLGKFVESVRPLGPALGPILVPAPGTMRCRPDDLETFASGLPAARWAIEMRHESFWEREVDEILRRHGVARVLNDEFHELGDYRLTSDFAYLRLRRGEYPLKALAARIRTLAEGAEVYVFVRHTDDPACTALALRIQDAVSR